MPQKHSRLLDGKRLIWYTTGLWEKAKGLDPFEVEVASIRELNLNCWFGPTRLPTLREVAAHCARINAASFDYPIILNADGTLMDGGHRLCKALLENRSTLLAVQFPVMPDPDEIVEVES